nr:archease [Candidatus Sigynarchaeota archaeon]
MATGHEFLSHPADIQVAVWAPTLEGLFKETGITLARVIVPGPKIKLAREIEVITEADDLKALLVDWLSDFLYHFDAELFVVGDIDVKSIEKNDEGMYRITSMLKGETFKKGHHKQGKEVKAITYSYMTLDKEENGGYRLTIIFDI